MTNITRRALACVVLTSLLLSLTLLAARAGDAQGNAASPTCPAGFVLDDAQAECTKSEPALVGESSCPIEALGQPGDCYTTTPKIDAGSTECAAGVETAAGCAVLVGDAVGGGPGCPDDFAEKLGEADRCVRSEPARAVAPECPDATLTIDDACFAVPVPLSQDPLVCPEPSVPDGTRCLQPAAPISSTGTYVCDNPAGVVTGRVCEFETGVREACPTGFVSDDSLGGTCARFEQASMTDPGCPDGSNGVADDCYILVARGPGSLSCANLLNTTTDDPDDRVDAVLIGTNCVLSAGAPTQDPPVCPAGFGIIDGECITFLEPVRAVAPCPENSTEDVDGECRRTVPNEDGSPFCDDPDAALNGSSCVFTAAFLTQSCAAGLTFDGGFCIQVVDAQPLLVCPIDASEDDADMCRVTIADVAGQFSCSDPAAELEGQTCIVRVDAVQPEPTPAQASASLAYPGPFSAQALAPADQPAGIVTAPERTTTTSVGALAHTGIETAALASMALSLIAVGTMSLISHRRRQI